MGEDYWSSLAASNFYFCLILVYLTLIANSLTINQNENIQHMAMSFVWAIDAFMTIMVGSRLDSKLIRISGLVLLFATLIKLIFIDLTYLSIFLRAFLFIVLGLFGIIISRIYYKSQPKKDRKQKKQN